MVAPWKLGECSPGVTGAFKALSNVFRDPPRAMAELSAEVVLLGNGGPQRLESCTPSGSASASDARIVVDAQYSNFPRCCSQTRMKELTLGHDGRIPPWAAKALESAPRKRFRNTEYYEWLPPSLHPPSPAVFSVPGHGGVPWFLVQGSCPGCRRTLKAILVATLSAENNTASYVDHEFLPLVRMIIDDRKVDKGRVFLLSASKGNELTLQAALKYPNVFAIVALAGKFRIRDALQSAGPFLLQAPDDEWRLRSLQFHFGDLDDVVEDNDFFPGVAEVLHQWPRNSARVDIRVYPSSKHPVWFGAWNALHDVVWTGDAHTQQIHRSVPTSCIGDS